MTSGPAPTPPHVSLTRDQWLRLIVAGIFFTFAFARVAPDVARLFAPIGIFGYATDYDAVVVRAPATPLPASDAIRPGDRVRIDRIPPFDRKPGLAGNGFTRDNPDRRLPIERGGRERILHLTAQTEPLASRITTLVRIIVFAISGGLGAILFLVKPSLGTFGFFIFCLGGEYATVYADLAFDNPWRQIPIWIGEVLRSASRFGLLLFFFSLLVRDRRTRQIAAWLTLGAAIAVGNVAAYALWLRDFGAKRAEMPHIAAVDLETTAMAAAALIGIAAFARASGGSRRRNGWILGAFLGAILARLIEDQYGTHLPVWINQALVTTNAIPAVAVWIAVVRDRFFNIDWVVSRAIVYTALTAFALGVFLTLEETLTYLFYNNVDLAYALLIAISMIASSLFGRVKYVVDLVVDRFIFRGRNEQRIALELIGGYILDAETEADVYRALLEDAAHALGLAFGGVLARQADGDYELAESYAWPADCVVRLDADDPLTAAIARTRGVLTFTGKQSALIQRAFPNERLTFAAPLFSGRTMTGIVVYGHNVSGLDLDPAERELLVRVVSNASIALSGIELARLRALTRSGSPYAPPAATLPLEHEPLR